MGLVSPSDADLEFEVEVVTVFSKDELWFDGAPGVFKWQTAASARVLPLR